MPVLAPGCIVTVPIQVFAPPLPAKSNAVARPFPASDPARTTVTPFFQLSMPIPRMLAPRPRLAPRWHEIVPYAGCVAASASRRKRTGAPYENLIFDRRSSDREDLSTFSDDGKNPNPRPDFVNGYDR